MKAVFDALSKARTIAIMRNLLPCFYATVNIYRSREFDVRLRMLPLYRSNLCMEGTQSSSGGNLAVCEYVEIYLSLH
jgi:hypothetical protein